MHGSDFTNVSQRRCRRSDINGHRDRSRRVRLDGDEQCGRTTITAGNSGSGNGSVSYAVAANSDTTSRTGTLTIGGKTFTVMQAGATCCASDLTRFSQRRGGRSDGVRRGDGAAGCDWTATSNAAWITISAGASGSGNGSVTYDVTRIPTPRHAPGRWPIAGSTFTITQAGTTCAPTISPTTATIAAAGGTVRGHRHCGRRLRLDGDE